MALAGQQAAQAAATEAQHSAQEALKQVGELQARLEAHHAATAAPDASKGAAGQSYARGEQQVGRRRRVVKAGLAGGSGVRAAQAVPTALLAQQQCLPWASCAPPASTAAVRDCPLALQADVFDLLVQLQEAEDALAEARAGGQRAGGSDAAGD